jgi:hypothetical protein
MFSVKFILTNICGHFECFFGKNYLYCTWLGASGEKQEISKKTNELKKIKFKQYS